MPISGILRDGDVYYGRDVEPKTLTVTGMSFSHLSGVVSWTVGSIFYSGNTYSLSSGSSGGSVYDSVIVATLNPDTLVATISFEADTFATTSPYQVVLGHFNTGGTFRMKYGV